VTAIVVDDDPTSRAVVASVMARLGHSVVEAGDGLEICRRIRAERLGRLSYVIMVTGRDSRTDVIAGLRAGANDYVTKPVNVTELEARIGVGCHVLELEEAAEREQMLRAVLETTGAVCHELNQPLQVATGWSEILLADLPVGDANRKAATEILTAARRMGALTRKLMTVSRYKTKHYLGGRSEIIDIDGASADARSDP
jgi:sigma-B regulation protein RsbU (phosphoserine phosphatase)